MPCLEIVDLCSDQSSDSEYEGNPTDDTSKTEEELSFKRETSSAHQNIDKIQRAALRAQTAADRFQQHTISYGPQSLELSSQGDIRPTKDAQSSSIVALSIAHDHRARTSNGHHQAPDKPWPEQPEPWHLTPWLRIQPLDLGLQERDSQKRSITKPTTTSKSNLAEPQPFKNSSAGQDTSRNFIDEISPNSSVPFDHNQVERFLKQPFGPQKPSSSQAVHGHSKPHRRVGRPRKQHLSPKAEQFPIQSLSPQNPSSTQVVLGQIQSRRPVGRPRKHQLPPKADPPRPRSRKRRIRDISRSSQDASDTDSLHDRRRSEAKPKRDIRVVSPSSKSSATTLLQNQPVIVHYPVLTQDSSRVSLLRHRELGGNLVTNIPVTNRLIHENVMRRDLTQWKNWTGASKDVITAAWNPNGRSYAVGSSTDLDGRNMQYNRHNNLLWGDIEQNLVIELDDHYIDRPMPEAAEHRDINNQNMYNAVDPRLFTTISSICFNNEGDRMFTGSYDRTVRVWDFPEKAKPPRPMEVINHEDRIELLSLSNVNSTTLLATAQCNSQRSISIYDVTRSNPNDPSRNKLRAQMPSERSTKLPLYPTALQWGTIPSYTDHLLLAGFAENRNDDIDRDREGDVLLWDIHREAPLTRLKPSAQTVFDLVWHPTLPVFAAATTPGNSLADRKNTKSVVRTWQPLQQPSRIMEFECPALDINEIRFHPRDDHYISAACTDGTTYFWDVRMPDNVLQKLSHGPTIEELYEDQTREVQDTGVRFTAWAQDGTHFYSGSSDGQIKCWKPLAAPEDVFIRDVATFDSGVMTASFSSDYSHLLVGLVKGSIQILSSSPWSHNLNSDDTLIRYLPASHFKEPPRHKRERSEDYPGEPQSKMIKPDPDLVLSTSEISEVSNQAQSSSAAGTKKGPPIGLFVATPNSPKAATGLRAR